MNEHVGKPITLSNFLPKVINRLSTIGLEIELYLLKLTGLIPIHTVRKLIYILAGIKISSTSTIYMGANFFNPRGITIGKDTLVGSNCFLDGRAPLKIGDHVGIASDVMIYNDEHNINSEDYGNSFGPVTINDYVFIGPRSIILPNVVIGKGAVIAAGAIVTKDVPEKEVWGGVPAKKISDRKVTQYRYTLGRPMLFQ